MQRISEQALLLGPRKSLVGVITHSSPPADETDRPMFVILNAGVIHRVGPNRMHVGLARALATLGYNVLRFDLSGIGDSDMRQDALAPLDASLADIREVLDSLESTRGVRKFVLIGLCSGANHAILYVGSDRRVVGLVLLDPSIPRTSRFYLIYYGRRLIRLSSWLNLALGRHPMWKALKRRVEQRAKGIDLEEPNLESREIRSLLERAYQSSVDKGVPMLAVFTAGLEIQHNYREQLLDAFPHVPFGALLRLEYFENSDHMFTSAASRERLFRLVVEWVEGAAFRAEPAGQPRAVVVGSS